MSDIPTTTARDRLAEFKNAIWQCLQGTRVGKDIHSDSDTITISKPDALRELEALFTTELAAIQSELENVAEPNPTTPAGAVEFVPLTAINQVFEQHGITKETKL